MSGGYMDELVEMHRQLAADLVKAEQAIVLLKNLVDSWDACDAMGLDTRRWNANLAAARAYLATIDDI